MGAAVFHTPILLVVTHNSKSKMEKVNDFAVIFDHNLPQPDDKQFSNSTLLCIVEV